MNWRAHELCLYKTLPNLPEATQATTVLGATPVARLLCCVVGKLSCTHPSQLPTSQSASFVTGGATVVRTAHAQLHVKCWAEFPPFSSLTALQDRDHSICCLYLAAKSCLTILQHPPLTVAHQAPLPIEILQARIPEWVSSLFSRGSSQPRDWTWVSCIGRQILYHWASREAQAPFLSPLKHEEGLPWRSKGLHATTAGGEGSILGWGTKIPHAA